MHRYPQKTPVPPNHHSPWKLHWSSRFLKEMKKSVRSERLILDFWSSSPGRGRGPVTERVGGGPGPRRRRFFIGTLDPTKKQHNSGKGKNQPKKRTKNSKWGKNQLKRRRGPGKNSHNWRTVRRRRGDLGMLEQRQQSGPGGKERRA